MPLKVLLATPPFTQLNTPYPATAYLKGFLNTKKIDCYQADLGIEVILRLFSRKGLTNMFDVSVIAEDNANLRRIGHLKEQYINTIDDTIAFLQGKNPTLSHRICSGNFLPEAGRFLQMDDLIVHFGSMGFQDKAKYMATMYLEDLSDFIKSCIDSHFGFSRYAEQMGRSANSFDELYEALHQQPTFIDGIFLALLQEKIDTVKPDVLGFSVPFPGNLYAAFRGAQFIKQHFPSVKTVMGGGFPNTELRSLKDLRVFEFFDFITLDDGEAPLENLLRFLEDSTKQENLKRTFVSKGQIVEYQSNENCKDYRQGEVGTPDYSDLLLDKYLSVIEVANPMHSLWSDGRWNKLTMAHGCYWGKCTFCDTSLDYISRYEPLTAQIICDRMETIIAQTGTTGFHFVDEAAPPALMREVALEIIRRNLCVSWWTNIRFEKSFTRDLCLLLRESGCIAVSGGLEVASDRLLALIQKGITVEQVARVNQHFAEAGIMVHAYLMYGYPTQTVQETIDSMEMVRQMFKAGILRSAFWHHFALTTHSPVGMAPQQYGVTIDTTTAGEFANNDLIYHENTGVDHDSFSFGLKQSLHNYMHATCLDHPLHKWFDFKVPKTTIPVDYIEKILADPQYQPLKPNTKVIWLGQTPTLEITTKSKKGATWEVGNLHFTGRQKNTTIQLDPEKAAWLKGLLTEISVQQIKVYTVEDIQKKYGINGWDDFELFWENKPVNTLYKMGLLQL